MIEWHDSNRSSISCRSCRSRKVKCDRRFPYCLACEKTSQSCSYPPGPSKPGPKIGQRKRGIHDVGDGTRHTAKPRLEPGKNTPVSVLEGPGSNSAEDNEPEACEAAVTEARVPDLSFILHPSHESSGSNNDAGLEQQSSGNNHRKAVFDRACAALGLERAEVEKLVETYFDNMVAINLFHQPSFFEKVGRILSSTHITALLAAMIAFSVRFFPAGDKGRQSQTDVHKKAAHFLHLASEYCDESLKECGDHTPPLCLLQAFVLVAHSQLTQGVLGRAWRALGTCVRVAYEMNLHLVDAHGPGSTGDGKRWCEDEEKRRTWWAVWEMDVFATTIRRTPTAVDWSQIETLLPMDNEHWFERKPVQSCFFQRDPILRWKALSNSGNQSPKAWFIVVNSLMKDAQRISSPRGIPNESGTSSDQIDEARQRLEIIANAVRCFQLALPSHLKYQQQRLGFEAPVPGQISSSRQIHSSIYNIYIMTQLARLMIYRYDVFKGRFSVALPTREPDINQDNTPPKEQTVCPAVKEYFEAADDMLTIIHRSCDEHICYINPFLSNSFWLASAVQLMRSQLCRPGAVKSAIKSRYEVLHLTYKKCVKFWDITTAVQQNLGTVEKQLEAWQQSKKHDNNTRNNTPLPTCPGERSLQTRGLHHDTDLSAPNANSNDIETPVALTPPSSNSLYPPDWESGLNGETQNATIPDTVSFPSADHSTMDQMIPSATLIDPMFLLGSTQSQGPWIEDSRAINGELDLDWSFLQVPNEFSDAVI